MTRTAAAARRRATVSGVQAPEILGGRYELRGILGRGGMAEVRDGWDRRLARPVAIKLLHPAFIVQADLRRRFETEARAAAALNHPHIIAVHDSGEHGGTPFIVMERLPGWSLADEVSRGPLPQDRVRSILDSVLSALAVAHAAGILHRDIKPGNILFTASGDVKVADFGIAKSAETPATMTGQIVGTMAYLSADRVAGRPATVADDLYAVAAVGYEALSGHKPFEHDNLVALARAIAEDVPPPLQMRRPDVDGRLAATIEGAMSRDPRWRFPSADAMRAALHVAPQPNSTRVFTEQLVLPVTYAAEPPPRRHRRLVVFAAALFAVALAAVVALFATAGPPSTPAPAGTSTSLPPPPSSSSIPPPPPPPAETVDQGPPGKKKDQGPGHKKGGPHGQ